MHRHIRILLALLLCGGIVSCEGPGETPSPSVTDLIVSASEDVAAQRYDAAMEKALQALDLSRQEGSALAQVQALGCLVGIDIMSSRDADAWEKALEAEAIARKEGFREELAGILISKAKLCSYAEISPQTGRNDEGLDYAREALSLAEETASAELEAEACYLIGSLNINKNRWNNPVDAAIYAEAGTWIDRGQAIADSAGIDRLRRNGILFRSRWFQQGGRNEEAIDYFEQALAALPESDYVTAAALDDRLVRLYTRVGEVEKALDAHDDYVFRQQKYMQQKQDETLQEMQTRFEVQEKDRRIERNRFQIALLVMLVLFLAALSLLVAENLRRSHRRTTQLQKISDVREQIIEFLAKDLRSPATAHAGRIEELSAQAATLSPEEIRERCSSLAEDAQSINEDMAGYVGDILIDRAQKIADIGLSRREIEIIRLSAEGLKASEIADRLFLSVHTVNTHRQRIYAKMDVKNVSDMIRKASELGIV